MKTVTNTKSYGFRSEPIVMGRIYVPRPATEWREFVAVMAKVVQVYGTNSSNANLLCAP